MTAFLNVTSSLTGRQWAGPAVEQERLREAMAQSTGLPNALCSVLVRSGVAAGEAEAFLAPKLRELLPNPMTLRDMAAAAERFIAAVKRRERIAVFADYDVDGGSSAALLKTWLRAMGHSAKIYIPDRIEEGYGPSETAMAELARDHDLILCVDCGTLSHDPIATAKDADVLVIDHHLGGETLPPALAVVNPNRQDESGDLGHLCAAAVVFLFLVEVNRRFREDGAEPPDLLEFLDLVALATVADVVPLIGVNRAFVRQGLKIMARRQRPGIAALSDAAQLQSAPSSYHLGYVLGPRINAGGRVGKSDLGARLLVTADPDEAASLAEKLSDLNIKRQQIEAAVSDAALEEAAKRGFDAPLVWAAGIDWHPGVMGIVAARLKEAANRPAVVIGFDGELGRGSGRSIAGVDLGSAVRRAASEGLLIKGGGHKMAAGLTVERSFLDKAMERLSNLLDRQGAGECKPRNLRLDGILMPKAATPELIERIEAAGPFGAGAPSPRFAFPDVRIAHARRVGSNHLKLSLTDGMGTRLDAIAFGAFATELGPALEAHGGAPFHMAGRLEINHWQGRACAQLRLEDAARAA